MKIAHCCFIIKLQVQELRAGLHEHMDICAKQNGSQDVNMSLNFSESISILKFN